MRTWNTRRLHCVTRMVCECGICVAVMDIRGRGCECIHKNTGQTIFSKNKLHCRSFSLEFFSRLSHPLSFVTTAPWCVCVLRTTRIVSSSRSSRFTSCTGLVVDAIEIIKICCCISIAWTKREREREGQMRNSNGHSMLSICIIVMVMVMGHWPGHRSFTIENRHNQMWCTSTELFQSKNYCRTKCLAPCNRKVLAVIWRFFVSPRLLLFSVAASGFHFFFWSVQSLQATTSSTTKWNLTRDFGYVGINLNKNVFNIFFVSRLSLCLSSAGQRWAKEWERIPKCTQNGDDVEGTPIQPI